MKQPRATASTDPVQPNRQGRELLSMAELTQEAGVTRQFLDKEIKRGRLIAIRLSSQVVRIRRQDWDAYLQRNSTATQLAS
jgi:hypothetical protein